MLGAEAVKKWLTVNVLENCSGILWIYIYVHTSNCFHTMLPEKLFSPEFSVGSEKHPHRKRWRGRSFFRGNCFWGRGLSLPTPQRSLQDDWTGKKRDNEEEASLLPFSSSSCGSQGGGACVYVNYSLLISAQIRLVSTAGLCFAKTKEHVRSHCRSSVPVPSVREEPKIIRTGGTLRTGMVLP